MNAIVVHPTDPRADAPSLTRALSSAQAGDVVLVSPGHYAPTRTGETLPLRIPAGVTVEGAEKTTCIIDGEGQFAPSFNPIRPDLSVLVLGEGARLGNVTVTNGGGHGIGVPPGVSALIRNCVISRNGDHGVFLCGVGEAVITGCVFQDNGHKRFEPALPRGTGARQGHHIFAEARHGQRNHLLITDNSMQRCFADGIACICFFPETDGVTFAATILRNTIEASERGGLLFSCSFGPSQNRLQLLAAENILRGNKQFGISILTAVPLAEKVPAGNHVDALLRGNDIAGSPFGIFVQGAVSEAQRNVCQVTIDRNHIADYKKNAIRLVGGMGVDGVQTQENTLQAVVSRNTLTGGTPALLVQGAGGTGKSNLSHNIVTARFIENEVQEGREQAIVVSDGPESNRVEVGKDSQAYTRVAGDLLG
jgi:hypothetical protein